MADIEKELADANKNLEKLKGENAKLTKENGELSSGLKNANSELKESAAKVKSLEEENAELKELLKNQAEEAKADKSSKEDGMVVFSVAKKKYGIPANIGEIIVPANSEKGLERAKFNVKDIAKYPEHAAWLVENSPLIKKY